jgi:hypothetical protein
MLSGPREPPKEIRFLFSTMMKIMNENLKVEYYRESLSKYNLNVTWKNIDTDPLRRDSVDRGQDTYREETFQHLLRHLYLADKKKLLLFLDDVLLQIPENNLLKAFGDELRTRLNALDCNNQDIDQMRIFTREWRAVERSQASAETATPHLHPHQIYIAGNYYGSVMGDVFSEIHNSNIINKSLVENSFNKVKGEHDEETGKVFAEVAKIIGKSGKASAGALFDKFNEELNKTQPEKSKLRDFWDGMVDILPSLATFAGVISKIIGFG